MFEHYQIPITYNDKMIQLPENSIEHITATDFHVPGDISSAAYFIVAGLITPGSDITPQCWHKSNTFRYHRYRDTNGWKYNFIQSN